MNMLAHADDQLVDAAGVRHAPAAANARIVCLVPSITELLCDLGLSAQLVGRSGFCIHPKEQVKTIPKLGGTKGVNIAKTRALAPSHVVVNVEENTKEDAAALAEFIPHVIVTYPVSPRDNLALYRLLGGIFARVQEAEVLCRKFEAAQASLEDEAKSWHRQNVLYLIWKAPWMTVSRDTYISRMLALVGWDTVPVNADTRWPQIAFDDATLDNVDLILLSSEPYRFREKHVAELRGLLPPRLAVALIDGEMTSWYGSRAIEALGYLQNFRRQALHAVAPR